MAEVRISVIIPTMNEEESMGEVMDAINKALEPEHKGYYEVLVVDTNSKDRTREIATEKGAVVIDEPRRGYGRAYKTGFAVAKGTYLATLDADCTYPADVIPNFVKILESEKLDFITGDRLSKLKKGVMSREHRIGNWVLKTTMNVLFNMRLRDSQSGMWVFRRSILDKIELISDGMPLSQEIKIEVWRKKLRGKEIPISYHIRKGEVKLNSWGDGMKNLKYLFAKRFNRAKP